MARYIKTKPHRKSKRLYSIILPKPGYYTFKKHHSLFSKINTSGNVLPKMKKGKE